MQRLFLGLLFFIGHIIKFVIYLIILAFALFGIYKVFNDSMSINELTEKLNREIMSSQNNTVTKDIMENKNLKYQQIKADILKNLDNSASNAKDLEKMADFLEAEAAKMPNTEDNNPSLNNIIEDIRPNEINIPTDEQKNIGAKPEQNSMMINN